MAAAGVLLAGCGAPSGVADQAEALGSTAAEGELLAHDAAEGSTTNAFTRVHARALARQATTVRDHAANPAVRRLAVRIETRLERLADEPQDRGGAARAEDDLGAAADRAQRLEGGA